jgi:nucleoid-associated protein YgaU
MAVPRLAALGLLALAAAACATAEPPGPDGAPARRTEPAATTRPVAVPATPAPPTPRQQLAARYRELAANLEKDGHLRRSLDAWRIALTIDPDDAAAREGKTKLESRIEAQVAERINEGRAALQRGSVAEARRRLLAALALEPANRAAFELLQNEVREVAFVSHTVRAGETLASLAQRYYGDRSRSEVIWETNQLPPNPRLAVGAVLKIPEIPGVPFNRPDAPRPAPPPPTATPAPTAPGVSPGRADIVREEVPPEVNPLLADAREALDRGEFAVALADVDKLLAGSPNHRDGLELKKVALYRQGKSQLEARKFDDSYRVLDQLAKIQPGYQDSARLLQQARARVIEQHYSEGIRLFRDEKLKEAIAEWKVVLDVDPAHANAKRNIEQAERLLRGIEQRRKR